MIEFEYKETLLDAIEKAECVLFTGAGINASSKLRNGKPVPSAVELAKITHQHFYPDEEYQEEHLALVCSKIGATHSHSELRSFFYKLFNGATPSEGLGFIPRFRWWNIYTTNIDLILEEVYSNSKEEDKAQNIKTIIGPNDVEDRNRKISVAYHKLHGCVGRIDVPLVFSLEEYAKSRESHLKLFQKLSIDLVDKKVLFIGYSMQDPNFVRLWNTLENYCNISSRKGNYFSVFPGASPSLKNYLKNKSITYIDSSVDEFMPWLYAQLREKTKPLKLVYASETILPEPIVKTEIPDRIKHKISSEYTFPELETAKAYPNVNSFYEGSPPTWGDIKYNKDAQRDIIEDLLTDVEIWLKNPKATMWVLIGEAGCGKTTVMMRLAYLLSQKYASMVLYSTFQSRLDSMDIIEIQKGLTRPVILFVDNVSDRLRKVRYLMANIFKNKIPLLVIGASRTSDWYLERSHYSTFRVTEYRFESLQDVEIKAILQKLKDNDYEKVLRDKTDREKFQIFKDKADRQLLVALKEATTGREFDYIIINEFSNIKSQLAQKAYGLVSFINQFRYHMPLSLLVRTLAIRHSLVKQDVFEYTEDIIFHTESIDGTEWLLSARHPMIASVVAENIAQDDTSRFELLTLLLGNIIPSYPFERSLVKKLFNCNTINQLFSSKEVSMTVYKRLREAFPEDPFLWQHNALYCVNVDEFDEARYCIKTARSIYPSSDVLKNTEGNIYLQESIKEEKFPLSVHLKNQGVKVLIQAIKDAEKGQYAEYHYHSLISKLLKWHLEKQNELPEEESEELLTEIQSFVDDAIRQYPNSSLLYTAAGQLEKILLNLPQAGTYFKKALDLDRGNFAARYLLAAVLTEKGDYYNALKICQEGTEMSRTHVLLNRLYIKLLFFNKEAPETIEAAFRKYLATQKEDFETQFDYAAFLYLNRKQNASMEFEKLRYAPVSSIEKRRPRNVFKKFKLPNVTSSGSIGKVFSKACLLIPDDYPKHPHIFALRASVEDGNHLTPGQRVEFELSFNYLGPVASKLRITGARES